MAVPDASWRLLHWRMLPSLAVAEVALVTGLSRSGVRRMLADGELERVPGTRLVKTESVVRRFGMAALEADSATVRRTSVKPAVRREAAAFLRKAEGR